MGRTEPVTMYFESDEKAAIEAEAEGKGETVSTYCRKRLQERRREIAGEELNDQVNLETRLERLMQEGKEEMQEVAAEMQKMHQQAGKYAIAHFILNVEDPVDPGELTPSRLNDAFGTANTRLHTPYEDHDLQTVDPTDSDQNGENGDRDGKVDDVEELL